MKVYTFSQARQRLAALLNEARREGEVRIQRRDGQVFVVQPAPPVGTSPLDVPGIDVKLGQDELLELLEESRRSTERFIKPSPPKRSVARTRRKERRPRSVR